MLILIDPSTMIGGPPTLKGYEKILHKELDPKVGIDFINPISIMELTPTQLLKNPAIVQRINNILKTQHLNLVYVDAHGGDKPSPFWGIGSYCWYSGNPGPNGHGGGPPGSPNRGSQTFNFDVRALTAPQNYASSPPKLVWIDTCSSVGSDGMGGVPMSIFGSPSPDFQWEVPFGIDTAVSSGAAQGVCLGWGGYATSYGGRADWTTWRNQLWNFLFSGGNNFQTAFNRDNNITLRGPIPNPKWSAFWDGVGTTSF